MLSDISTVINYAPGSSETAETTGHYAETSNGTGSREANQVTGFSEATQAAGFTWATCASGSTQVTVSSKATILLQFQFQCNWQAETSYVMDYDALMIFWILMVWLLPLVSP